MFPLFVVAFACASPILAQETLSPIAAGADDPVFTTYAAPLARSEYLVDEGYHLRFYDDGEALALTSDSAGSWGVGFVLGEVVAHVVGDYARKPVIRQSSASTARFDFEPFHQIIVDARFTTYSSRESLLELTVKNESDRDKRLTIFAFAASDVAFRAADLTPERDGIYFGHDEPVDALSESPPPGYDGRFQDLLLTGGKASAFGGYPAGEVALVRELNRGLLSGDLSAAPRALLLSRDVVLAPGQSAPYRLVRAVAPASEPRSVMRDRARALLAVDVAAIEREEAELLRGAPRLHLDAETDLVYRGALSLARQSMLPAEGRTRHNYYVFSREPTWSWGHDGQVFHESLSMLAYAHLDAESAMESQRVFMEAQEADGYIPYRVGPYVVRTFPVDGQKTTSAPFYSWVNWEIFEIAPDAGFLPQAYDSGQRFMEFLLANRDADGDGILEWGGHAVLESVRDSLVPIWDLLAKDDPRAPSLVEALDLNAMVVKEMRALGRMAKALGRESDWDVRASELAALVNRTMWDDATGFYYNVDRDTNAFVTPGGLDLRRQEIIGFLPMWAGIATKERAEVLVRSLTDEKKFWRRFGVPTLAADDPGYQPLVTRCCQWNGAVWLEWNYLVFRGLRDYGYDAEARDLGSRMVEAAATQLQRNHRFWESYSPDEVKLGSPRNYIWNSILARVLIDLES